MVFFLQAWDVVVNVEGRRLPFDGKQFVQLTLSSLEVCNNMF